MTSNAYKIVMVSDARTGKTSLVEFLRSGHFTNKYLVTLGPLVYNVDFETNYGLITFTLWDTPGDPRFGTLRHGYYIKADGAMVFYDQTPSTYDSCQRWATEILEVTGEIPAVVVRTKSDLGGEVHEGSIPISIKNDVDVKLPFQILARQLTGLEDLVFM